MLFLIAILLAIFLPMPVKAETVWNGYNYYMGKYYGESETDIAKLKALLEEDGYICVSYGSDYEEIADYLINIDSYWYKLILKENTDYQVYVPKREILEYVSGSGECSTWTINMASVVLDYYAFHHTDDMSISYSEDYGENISDNSYKGFIRLRVEMPPQYLENSYKYDTKITVTLHGEEQNKDYKIEISGSNNYEFRDYFLCDRYKITSALFANDEYGILYNEDYYRLNEGEEITFLLSSTSKENIKEHNASLTNPNPSIAMTLVKDLPKERRRNPYALGFVALLSLTMLLTGIVKILLFIMSNQNTNEEYKDTFRFRWVLYIFGAIFLIMGYICFLY